MSIIEWLLMVLASTALLIGFNLTIAWSPDAGVIAGLLAVMLAFGLGRFAPFVDE